MCCVFLFECTTGDRDNPFDPVNISGVGTGDYTNNNTTTPFIAPPRITGHPKDEVVTEGNIAMFSVVATGSGLSYQWKRNGWDKGSNSKSYSYTATMSRDGDSVWCVVSNSAGSVTSNTAILTVEPEEISGEIYDANFVSVIDWDNDGFPEGFTLNIDPDIDNDATAVIYFKIYQRYSYTGTSTWTQIATTPTLTVTGNAEEYYSYNFVGGICCYWDYGIEMVNNSNGLILDTLTINAHPEEKP